MGLNARISFGIQISFPEAGAVCIHEPHHVHVIKPKESVAGLEFMKRENNMVSALI